MQESCSGSIGPIDLPPQVVARMLEALDALCARTGLVGINSCDFLLDGDAFEVLEINARPSSTMALYEAASPDAWPPGFGSGGWLCRESSGLLGGVVIMYVGNSMQ